MSLWWLPKRTHYHFNVYSSRTIYHIALRKWNHVGKSVFKNNFIYLFVAVPGLCCWAGFSLGTGAAFCLRVRAFHCSGFSCCGARALGIRFSNQRTGSAVVERGLWDLPRPGVEPMSPALAGGFFTTEPPGTPPRKSVLIL